jgi:hypothetical protein
MSVFLDNLIGLSLTLFFVHYLINHSEIFGGLRWFFRPHLPELLVKMLKCGLCLSFWVMLLAVFFFDAGFLLFCVPVGVLFLDLIYHKLTATK